MEAFSNASKVETMRMLNSIVDMVPLRVGHMQMQRRRTKFFFYKKSTDYDNACIQKFEIIR